MKPAEIAAINNARFAASVRRVALVALALLLAFALGLVAGCASDLDDAQAGADDATAALVWHGTWGYGLGAPPRVVYEEPGDPRCGDPRAYWEPRAVGPGVDGCVLGHFDKATGLVHLSKDSAVSLSHELAHAAATQFAKRTAPIFQVWSDNHTAEFSHQVCRALVRHRAISGVDFRRAECPRTEMEAIERDEDVK